MPYVEIEHVTKKFGSDVVLKDINISMEEGRVYGICGNNGSGKTVLMKCICGFLPVSSGVVRVAGEVVGITVDFPESMGVIIETPGFLMNLSGIRNLEILAGLRGVISKGGIRAAMEVGFLDEPFNGLDKHGVSDIRALLLELKKQGKTILLASHNSEDIRILCDQVFEMDGGRIREL